MENGKLKSFSLDVDSGVLLINREEIKNVTAFSLVFANGEYGLSVTSDKFYKASTRCKKIILNLHPSEILQE